MNYLSAKPHLFDDDLLRIKLKLQVIESGESPVSLRHLATGEKYCRVKYCCISVLQKPLSLHLTHKTWTAFGLIKI